LEQIECSLEEGCEIAKKYLGGRNGRYVDEAFAAYAKEHGADTPIKTRTICFIIARRLRDQNYDWAHFPDCHFRDDPHARRWNPFQRVVRLMALNHNEAIEEREEQALADQFAQVGIEEGEAELVEDDLVSEDTLDFSHLKDDQCDEEAGEAEQEAMCVHHGKADSESTVANLAHASYC